MNKEQLLEKLNKEYANNRKRADEDHGDKTFLSDYFLGVSDGYAEAYEIALTLKE